MVRIEDFKYYCYIPGLILKEILAESDQFGLLDHLVQGLEVPGKPAVLKKLSNAEKLRAIENQAEHFRESPTSLWRNVEIPEILAASIWRHGPPKVTQVIFGAVKKENDLLKPAGQWLRAKDLKVYDEVPMGTKRVDLAGYKEGGWFSSDQIISIELKNDIEQLKRGLDQMTTFADYSSEVYMACTPAMAATYLDKHAEARNVRHWEPEVLNDKLRKFGFGLLLIDGKDAQVALPAKQLSPSSKNIKETIEQMKNQRPLLA